MLSDNNPKPASPASSPTNMPILPRSSSPAMSPKPVISGSGMSISCGNMAKELLIFAGPPLLFRMPPHRRHVRPAKSLEDWRENLTAKLAVFFLLLNIFIWTGLRGIDPLVPAVCSIGVSLVGMLLGQHGLRRLRRRFGTGSGESVALIGLWGNRIVLGVCLLLFVYLMAVGILKGDFL